MARRVPWHGAAKRRFPSGRGAIRMAKLPFSDVTAGDVGFGGNTVCEGGEGVLFQAEPTPYDSWN